MLIIMTGAKTAAIRKTIGEVLVRNSPVEHAFMNIDKELPPLGPGEVLLCCGAKMVEKLQDMSLIPKGRTVTSLRGKEVPYMGGSIFITFDPGVVERDYARFTDIQWDTQLAIRKVKTGTTHPTHGDYKYVNNFTKVINYVKKQYEATGKPVKVSCDLETVGLDEYNSKAFIVSIAVTPKAGVSHMIRFKGLDDPKYPPCPGSIPEVEGGDLEGLALRDQIEWILTTPMITMRGANFKYDLRWMRKKWGIECTNFKMDTTLVGSLLNENRSNSLNNHTKIYVPLLGGYDDPFNAMYDKSRMDLVPDSDLLIYGGGDTDACYQVADSLQKELLAQHNLTRFYITLLHPAARAFEDLEEVGVCVDYDYFFHPVAEYTEIVDEDGKVEKHLIRGLKAELETTIKSLEDQAIAVMPKRLQYKHIGNLSLSRPDVIIDYMFTPLGLNLKPLVWTAGGKDGTKKKKPSTSLKDHLNQFADHPQAGKFIKLLKEVNSAKKTLSTYVDGFFTYCREDSRFHGTYFLFKGANESDEGEGGTNTGRTSCVDPALQTIPKHSIWAKKLRRGYIAPPGYVIVNWDYSQGELRVIACLADEKTMIQKYKDGIDLHMVTGGILNGYDEQEMLEMKLAAHHDKAAKKLFKAIRQGGKAGNFGLIYGMSAGGYMVYALTSYGVTLTEAQAASQRDAFFALYPGLVEYHKEYKSFAHANGYVVSPLGRIRHLPLINGHDREMVASSERFAINSPVQGTLSDMGLFSLALFKKEYGRPEGCKPFMFTHDAITAYVKEDQVDIWVPRVKEIMENLPLESLGWYPQLKFDVDFEISDPNTITGKHNLADLIECEGGIIPSIYNQPILALN